MNNDLERTLKGPIGSNLIWKKRLWKTRKYSGLDSPYLDRDFNAGYPEQDEEGLPTTSDINRISPVVL